MELCLLKQVPGYIKIAQMNNLINNSVFQYVLIACLAIALMVGQAFKLHMHVEPFSSTTTVHKLNVHVAATLHDFTPNISYQDEYLAEIEVTPDNFVKKIESFNPYILLFLFVIFFLGIPKLRSVFGQHSQTNPSPNYYLLSPPLRAPPVHSSI
ncbi:MAG: hypothetical protein OQK75_02535 [Gammaproteobacteria bacterium]|nr:hypothetical protein [Gammaproteobacteria bacterium]MCW8986524.1 hypothetical protein [Gammaproteobacteria bacterium]